MLSTRPILTLAPPQTSLWVLSHTLRVFHINVTWSLSNNKSPQVSSSLHLRNPQVCIYAILKAYKSSFSFFSWSFRCKPLCIVTHFLILCSICLSSFPLSISRTVQCILQEGLTRCLSIRWAFCCKTWFQAVFPFVWKTFFFSFLFYSFHLRLFNYALF